MAKSSLKSVIAAAKAPPPQALDGTPLPSSILADLTAFMFRKAQEPRIDPDWEDRDVFHPSAVANGGMCPRFEQIRRVREDLVVNTDGLDVGLQRIFLMGTALHDMYQNEILGPMGVLFGRWFNAVSNRVVEGFMPGIDKGPREYRKWKYVEPAMFHARYNVGGHTDGIVFFPGRPPAYLEMKSINSFGFAKLTAPHERHVRQLQMYMHADPQLTTLGGELKRRGFSEIEWGVILYLEKNQSQERDFWVRRDAAPLKDVFASLGEACRGLVSQELSARVEECSGMGTKRAASCGACGPCFKVGTGRQGWLELRSMAVPTVSEVTFDG